MTQGDSYPRQYLYRRVVQAKVYIDAHFTEFIDLDQISDEAHFSKFHFIRLFKKVYGLTPHKYLTQVRLDQAKLLLAKNLSISESCYRVGFESLSSFSGLFKRRTGYSPRKFQLLVLHKKNAIAISPLDFIPGCLAKPLVK